MKSIKLHSISPHNASVRCYHKFEILSINSILCKGRVDFCLSRLSQAPPLAGVSEPHLQKHVSAISLTESRVFTHMHNYETEHSLLLLRLLFDLLWSCCLCPYGNVTDQRAIPFHYDPHPESSPLSFRICAELQIDANISKGHTSSGSKAQFALSSHQSLHLDLSTSL